MQNKLPGKFTNLDPLIKPKGWLDVLKWKLSSKNKPWPKFSNLEAKKDTSSKNVRLNALANHLPHDVIEDNKIRITYVGHVTFLVQVCGLNILTDPIWSNRASPFSFIGPKRVVEPGIAFNELPKIDLILISHNHYDHLDIPTIRKLMAGDKPKIITPLKNDITLKRNIKNIEVTALDWFDSIKVKDFADTKYKTSKVEIHLEPARHWSARGLFDKNEALWGSFIIKTPEGCIFFIGDSGYDEEIYKEIGRKYNINVSLIPIGAYEPRDFMKDMHMNPEEAVLVHKLLKTKYSIASHFDTFKLADEGFGDAPKALLKTLKEHKIGEDVFIIPETGSSYTYYH